MDFNKRFTWLKKEEAESGKGCEKRKNVLHSANKQFPTPVD